jgi:rhodanese-related sulfurtransferase
MSDGNRGASRVSMAATALAVLSCYGTTPLIALLSLLGASLALDEAVWAAVISVLAALAALAIAVSYRRHRIVGPTLAAAAGLALILWALYGSYSRVVELAGFVLLIAAVLWDWRASARTSAAVDGVSWIDPASLAERLGRDPKPVIIDVRGADEFDGPLGHIADALNLPVGELPNRLMEIEALKGKPVILVCRTDKRSANAAALLGDAGFRDARVLRGGMERWNRSGLPLEGRATLGQA